MCCLLRFRSVNGDTNSHMVLRHSWASWYWFCVFNYEVTIKETEAASATFLLPVLPMLSSCSSPCCIPQHRNVVWVPKAWIVSCEKCISFKFLWNWNKSAVSRHEPKKIASLTPVRKQHCIELCTMTCFKQHDLFPRLEIKSLLCSGQRIAMSWVLWGACFFLFCEILSTVFCSLCKLSIIAIFFNM